MVASVIRVPRVFLKPPLSSAFLAVERRRVPEHTEVNPRAPQRSEQTNTQRCAAPLTQQPTIRARPYDKWHHSSPSTT